MVEDTSSLLSDFFARYAQAASSRNPNDFAQAHFDRSLLCPTDRLLPFEFEKSDQRALARSEQQRRARSGHHALSFEIRDMVGGLPGEIPGHLYVTVAWHLNVRPLVEKSGADLVVIGYLLRIEGERIDIIAASILEGGPEKDEPPEDDDDETEPSSEDGLTSGDGDRRAGHIAG